MVVSLLLQLTFFHFATALKMSRDLALGHSGASQNVGNQLRPGMSSVKV